MLPADRPEAWDGSLMAICLKSCLHLISSSAARGLACLSGAFPGPITDTVSKDILSSGEPESKSPASWRGFFCHLLFFCLFICLSEVLSHCNYSTKVIYKYVINVPFLHNKLDLLKTLLESVWINDISCARSGGNFSSIVMSSVFFSWFYKIKFFLPLVHSSLG